jgi:phosphotransferase family enzyme
VNAVSPDAIDLSSTVERRHLTGLAESFSGARLEEAVLADGRRLILKYLPTDGDWLTRATRGAGRCRTLWKSGLLARIPAFVDHTIIDVREVEGQDVVVMREATGDLLPPRIPVSREVSRVILARLAAFHDAFTGEPAEGLCSNAARYGMFAPAFHAADAAPGPHPLAARIVAGWELFAEHVDADLVGAIFAVHQEPEILGRRLARFPWTLLHGDAKLENLGLGSNDLVAIDWGDLTGFGPPEVDLCWYALKGAARIGCSPDELFADYQAATTRPLEPEALDLACIGSLAQMGFRFAVGAFASGPASHGVDAAQLAWWTARARTALDRVG